MTPEAQQILDEASALFPGRYVQGEHHGQLAFYDAQRADRLVAWGADVLAVAKKVRTAARLSAGNGNRQYAEGHAPHPVTVTVPAGLYRDLEAEAAQRGVTVPELIVLKLMTT